MEKCPIPNCSTTAANWYTLMTHLKGRPPKGHGVPEMDAEAIAKDVFNGTYRAPAASPPKVVAQPTYSAALRQDPYAGFLIHLFETLASNKRLPKYQFERRVDAMVSLFLPDILTELKGWRTELIVPEFPLKKAANNQSTNADHLLFRHADGAGPAEAWVLFELKTDSDSCREEQLDAYLSAIESGMPKLISDLDTIATASNDRAKYAELRSRVARFPPDRPLHLVYLAPCRIQVQHPRVFALTFQDLADLSLSKFPEVWDLFRSMMLPSLRDST